MERNLPCLQYINLLLASEIGGKMIILFSCGFFNRLLEFSHQNMEQKELNQNHQKQWQIF